MFPATARYIDGQYIKGGQTSHSSDVVITYVRVDIQGYSNIRVSHKVL